MSGDYSIDIDKVIVRLQVKLGEAHLMIAMLEARVEDLERTNLELLAMNTADIETRQQ